VLQFAENVGWIGRGGEGKGKEIINQQQLFQQPAARKEGKGGKRKS